MFCNRYRNKTVLLIGAVSCIAHGVRNENHN